MVIKFKIKEMHFMNVNHWAHALYRKILNTFTLLFAPTVNYDILPL